MAASPLIHADDPKPTVPPGYKLKYVEAGGKKMPILVKDQLDPLRNVTDTTDPLDHQKVFSETNLMANKTFNSGVSVNWNKSADMKPDFETKVYNSTGPTSVYNLGTKSTFQTAAFAGGRDATGYNRSFATSTADVGQNETAAFAAIGSPDQDRTAPINAKAIDKFSSPMANKLYMTRKADGVHHNEGELGNGTSLSQLPDRPLTIDEVGNLINHGFKPDTSEPPPPASKPLNDPGYQPEPLRIEPTEAETPTPKGGKDDDADDPVPSPGTMAEPLPK